MAIKKDLTSNKEIVVGLQKNKVTKFCYTDKAYKDNDVDGVRTYSFDKEQNIPDLNSLETNATVITKGYRTQASSLARMLVNHIFGRVSYNLNKIVDTTSNLITSIDDALGKPNGIATLDANGRIPYSQLPESAMEYKGMWDAETNTPTLTDGEGTKGDMYVVSVSGTQTFGGKEITFLQNDQILYDGEVWNHLSAGSVRTVNSVTPDEKGNVLISSDNIEIKDSAIKTNMLAKESVTTDKIYPFAVKVGKIADNAVTNGCIKDYAVTFSKLADHTVITRSIAPKQVTTDKLADGAVTTDKIANGAVTADKIAEGALGTIGLSDGSVTEAKIASNAVTTAKIVDGAVTEAKIASNAVTTAKIVDGAVTEAKIGINAVTGEKIATDAVTTIKIKDGVVTTNKIADSAVTTDKIANNAVTIAKIKDGAVATNKIADSAVTTDKIATRVVTEAKIATDAVTATKIKNASVTTAKIATDAVTTLKIKDASVTTAKIATDAVTATKIKDAHVIEAKIATDAVTTNKIKNANVTEIKLASNAVTTDKIKDANVTEAKIASNAVTTAKIADGAITADKIASNAVTTAKIADGAITADKIAFKPDTYTGSLNRPQNESSLRHICTKKDILNFFDLKTDELSNYIYLMCAQLHKYTSHSTAVATAFCCFKVQEIGETISVKILYTSRDKAVLNQGAYAFYFEAYPTSDTTECLSLVYADPASPTAETSFYPVTKFRTA